MTERPPHPTVTPAAAGVPPQPFASFIDSPAGAACLRTVVVGLGVIIYLHPAMTLQALLKATGVVGSTAILFLLWQFLFPPILPIFISLFRLAVGAIRAADYLLFDLPRGLLRRRAAFGAAPAFVIAFGLQCMLVTLVANYFYHK